MSRKPLSRYAAAAATLALACGLVTMSSATASAATSTGPVTSSVGSTSVQSFDSVEFNLVNSSGVVLTLDHTSGKTGASGLASELDPGKQQVFSLPGAPDWGHSSGDAYYQVVSDGVYVGQLDIHMDAANTKKDTASLLGVDGPIDNVNVNVGPNPNGDYPYLDTFTVVNA